MLSTPLTVIKLSWGNLIAIVLPGLLGLLIVRMFSESTDAMLAAPNSITVAGGFYLLGVSVIFGGVIDGVRRVLVDEGIINKFRSFQRTQATKSDNLFRYLDKDTLPVFSAGVEESYRYYTFYANLGLSALLVFVIRLLYGEGGYAEALFWVGSVVAMFTAASVQWMYFSKFRDGFVDRYKVDKGTVREE